MSEIDPQLGELRRIVAQSDFTQPEGFGTEQEQGDAIIYRELIWQLAQAYGRATSFIPEMTHSERGMDPTDATKFLDFCMVFDSEDEAATTGQGLGGFKEYLQERYASIPNELRQAFRVYIGYNYNDDGAIVVDKDTVTRISQADYDAVRADGFIGYNKDVATQIALMKAVSKALGGAALQ